uniref:Uncharacterized protein n=1 Tax=Aegilops tauschii subsp. strangulata TaxID=200361 RepID=A0A453E991_AEGTS
MRTCPMWCYLPSVIFVGIAEKSLMPLDIFASKIKKSDAYQFSCRGSYQRRIDNLRKRFESLSGRRRWFSSMLLSLILCGNVKDL